MNIKGLTSDRNRTAKGINYKPGWSRLQLISKVRTSFAAHCADLDTASQILWATCHSGPDPSHESCGLGSRVFMDRRGNTASAAAAGYHACEPFWGPGAASPHGRESGRSPGGRAAGPGPRAGAAGAGLPGTAGGGGISRFVLARKST
jgi:hypothetical protein